MARDTTTFSDPSPFEGDAPDPETIQAVKDILHSLGKTVSALKLFPDSHIQIIRFRQDLLARIQAYFELHDELEIEIEPGAFLFDGTPVYSDDNVLHSLPYLFFKDGMKTLTLFKGINGEELSDLLGLIKTTSLLPVETGDIVDALWQKELSHVAFHAPDGYLEAQINASERIPTQFQVYKSELYRGRIELRAEDVATMFAALREAGDEAPPADDVGTETAARLAGFDETEQRRLEALLSAERGFSESQESLELMFELLRAEDRPEIFEGLLEFLEQAYASALERLDFEEAVSLMARTDRLLAWLDGASPETIGAAERFRAGLKERWPREEIRRAAAEHRIPSSRHLMEYLALLGPPGLSLAAELYERSRDAEFRVLARDLFEAIGRSEPLRLAELVRGNRPVLAKAIIDILGRMHDPGVIPALVPLLAHADRAVRLRAVQVLAGFDDATARTALKRSLLDESEEVRIEAAAHVRLAGDPAAVREWIGLVEEGSFPKKSPAERSALLVALGRSGTAESATLLRELLLRSGWLGRAKRRETRLGAVRALEAHGGPAAVEALEAGSRAGDRKVRAACRQALARLPRGEGPPGKEGP